MSVQLKITDEALQKDREAAQGLLRQYQVPQTFNDIDRGVYGFTRTHLDLLEALEQAIALLHRCACTLEPAVEDGVFTCIYSAYVASQVVLDKLPPAKVRIEGTFSLNDAMRLLKTEPATLAHAITTDYLQYLDFYKRHPDPSKRVDGDERLVACTRAYFSLLANTVREMADDPRFAPLLDRVKQAKPEVLGRKFNGFDSTAATPAAEPSGLLDVHTDDVVGNQDFLKAGMRLARDVAGFDLQAWQNPKKLNPVLFAMGDPGCGKTVTCHAIGNYFLEFCKQRDIPAQFVVIRRTDWASSYQNASAGQLIDIFKSKVAGFKGVVGVYWPDIDTAFAARDDSGLHSEEKNILGACFGIFDGTIIPKNGQWFMMTDANTLNMDKATISRITQDPFQLKGPILPADFVRLTRDIKLRGLGPYLDLSEEQWTAFGTRCIELKLSGRAIENISRKITSEIEDFEYPEEYFKADLARRKEIISQCSQHIAYERLIAIIEHYVAFEQEAEERARKARFNDRVQEIVLATSAHAAALGLKP
jgi:hypothetical protein